MFRSPSHPYPTGALMSHGRPRQLLDYAAMHRLWIVENDYDSEFRYGARPLPALQGQDEHNRVIYLGTFSKTLFPAMRLSYLVLPLDLEDSFARALSELFREGQTYSSWSWHASSAKARQADSPHANCLRRATCHPDRGDQAPLWAATAG
jgi:DNA-binding transcriptional MocR family regulator